MNITLCVMMWRLIQVAVMFFIHQSICGTFGNSLCRAVGCTCSVPPYASILINNTKPNATAVKRLLTNNSYEVSVNVSMECSSGKMPSLEFNCDFAGITWKVKKKILERDKIKDLVLTTHRIKCLVRSTEGLLLFSPSVDVELAKPDLVAQFTVNYLSYLGKMSIALNAKPSFDPDRLKRVRKDLKYVWSCRLNNETFSDANDVIVDKPRRRQRKPSFGCFGYGPGRIKSHKRKVFIAAFETNQTLVFRLLLHKQGRGNATAYQILQPDSGPKLRCIENCDDKVNVAKRTVVTWHCEALWCKDVRLQWYLHTMDDEHEAVVQVDLQKRISTKMDSPTLALKGMMSMNESSLKENTTYRISVKYISYQGSTEVMDFKYLIFTTNSKPHVLDAQGGCSVSPMEGVALNTSFEFKCVGWIDEDKPLTYVYKYRKNSHNVTFYEGQAFDTSAWMPLGDPKKNFSLVVEMVVQDAFGASDSVLITIKVLAAKALSVDEVDGLLDTKDPVEAMQIALTILASGGDGDREAEIKEKVLNKMVNVSVESLSDVKKMASVVNIATGEEVTPAMQDDALGILDDMVTFLSRPANCCSDDPSVLKEAGSTLLNCISNVMATTNTTKDIGDEKGKAQEIENVKKSLELTDKMGSVLLQSAILDEEHPQTFETKSFRMLLGKHRPVDARVEITDGVVLPSSRDLFGNESANLVSFSSQVLTTTKGRVAVIESLGVSSKPPSTQQLTQLINYPENPYNWDTSSKSITSSVVDFTLKTDEGTTIDVKGLKNTVELYIPRNKKAADTSQPSKFFAKSNEDDTEIQYHSLSVQSDDTVSLTIVPTGNRSVAVYVSAKERPNPSSYNFMTVLPNITFCQDYKMSNCSREAYTFSISSAITGATGQHYVGIVPLKRGETGSAKPTEKLRLRVARDCGSHNGRRKRSCILTKAPPPTPVPPTELIRPVYDASTDVNYTMSVNVASCKYWSNKTNTWTSEGCKAGPKSVSDKIQCLCTHLSAFGGNFFVPPNPIDFDVVFERGIGDNYSVLVTVCIIFALYFLCLIYARRADKKDHAKVVADVVVARDFSDEYQYQIYVRTGIWRGYGTSAKVGIVLYGENGRTDNIYLTDSQLNRKFFARASVNQFTLCLPESLGQLYKIELWHDDTGNNSSWFVEDVCIVDSQTTDEWHFIARQWLAIDKGEGELKVEIRAADEKQLKAVGNLTYTRAAKSFADTHLWFSIFTKPPHNKFTRCQRLSCCLSTLFAAMIANAMFYQFGKKAEDTFKVGPLEVSWTLIRIGIQSSLVAVPVNVLLVLIFRSIKEPKRDRYELTKEDKTQDGCLPHFFVYIAWLLCLATAITSATFIVFYSIQWGKEKSNQWLTSILVSLIDDILVIQPLKIVLLASLVSMIMRKLPKREDIVGPSLWRRGKSSDLSVTAAENQAANPTFEDLQHRRKVSKMYSTIAEIVTFLVFVILLMIVCYGNRNVTRYMITKSLDETFGEFEDVGEPPEFWNWTRDTLLPGLYEATWYNDRPFDPKEGYISTREAFMIGMPRLRQIRVESEPECNVRILHVLREMFQRCLPLNMADDEDTTRFQTPGWIPVHNVQEFRSDFEELCPKPWRYFTAEELQTTSFYGQTYSYGGGGYVADLGYTSTSANEVIDILEKNIWIDDRTAGVFVEFAVFEPSTSLVTSVKYLYERLATGQTNTVKKVKTMTLYSPADPGLRSIYEVCQLLFILVICFMLFAEIVKLASAQTAYFKHFWNWVELIEIASAASSLAMFFLKEKYTSTFVKNVHANPFETFSADYLVLWSDLEVALLSFVIFIVTIKFLRIIRYNRHVCQMMATFKRSSKSLVSFSAVFITALLGFSHLGYLAFGRSLEAYSTFGGTLSSMLTMTLGGRLYYDEIFSVDMFIGPSFLFVYMLVIACVLVNLFVTILMDAYSEVSESVSGADFSDADLGDFMADYIKKRIKSLQRKIVLWWKERSRKNEAETPRRRSSGGLRRASNLFAGKRLQRRPTIQRMDGCKVDGPENVELITMKTENPPRVDQSHSLRSGAPVVSVVGRLDMNSFTWHNILMMYTEEEVNEDRVIEDICGVF